MQASVEEMSLDDLIRRADIIVLGDVDIVDASRWNTIDGNLPDNITAKTITSKYIIYTDQVFLPQQIIKGIDNQESIRIRNFGGQVGQDIMTMSPDPTLDPKEIYLLFLVKDSTWSSENDQAHYIILGADQGLYKVSDGKAVSFRDEWVLQDLIGYIQKGLSTSTTSP